MLKIIKELLDLRNIRNSCREYMTRDIKHISIWRQFVWYFKVYRPKEKKGLMKYHFIMDKGKPIGYGLLDIQGDKEWVSGGIIPTYWGKGWGEVLFFCLTNLCKKTPYLEVLKSNKRAINLYKKLDYEIVGETRRIFIMKYGDDRIYYE